MNVSRHVRSGVWRLKDREENQQSLPVNAELAIRSLQMRAATGSEINPLFIEDGIWVELARSHFQPITMPRKRGPRDRINAPAPLGVSFQDGTHWGVWW